jgi:hypothetical protein
LSTICLTVTGKSPGAELMIAKKQGRYRFNYLDIAPIQRIHWRWIKEHAESAAELLCELKEQLENA